GPVDAVTLASPSAAEALHSVTAAPGAHAPRWPVVASLGTTTAEAARRIAADRHVTAQQPGFGALADAVAQAFHPEGS
ncbi:MAG: uroporphyrinogen-III synthase, partial [Gemmatimonadetes bacterium]|nr:uroporphyrinogen-III synthase [Gemmatimonadota bacterium]